MRYDAPSIQSYQLEITLLHSICVEKSRYDEHRLGCHRYRQLLRVGPFLFKLLSTSKHFSDMQSVLALWSSGFKRKRKRFANINVEKSSQCWELLTKKCNSFLLDPVIVFPCLTVSHCPLSHLCQTKSSYSLFIFVKVVTCISGPLPGKTKLFN